MRGKTNKNTLAQSAKELREGTKKKTRLKVKIQNPKTPIAAKAKEPPVAKIKKSTDYPSAKEVIQRARSEREKKIVMWSGVSVLMLAIIIFWVINTRELILSSASTNEDTGLSEVWLETQKEFEAGIEDFQTSLEIIKESNQTESADIAGDEISSQASQASQASQEAEAAIPAGLPENLDITELEEELSNQ